VDTIDSEADYSFLEVKLLNRSLQMFEGWSYGFGDVDVINIAVYAGDKPMFVSTQRPSNERDEFRGKIKSHSYRG